MITIKTPSFVKPIIFLLGITLSSSGFADTLRDAIECAMHLNPDVRFAAAHRWTTEEQLQQQKAGYYPVLDLAAGEGLQNSNNPTSHSFFNGQEMELTRTESSLSLTENLFRGFATKNEVSRLQETVKAAAYKTGGTAEDVALKAAAQYLEVLRHQKLVVVAKENLVTHENSQGMISQRTEAGISRAADLAQADARLASAHASWIAEVGNLVDAQTSYIRAIGEPPHDLVQPSTPSDSQLPATEAKAIDEALANNPTLKSANADVLAARAQHETSKAPDYPSIDLVFSASRNNNLDGDPGVNNDEKAMVRGTWNLFKGGQDVARQHETAYQVQEALDVRNRTIWQIREDTRLSWNAWKVSQDRLKFLKEHRDYAAETVNAYRDQFKLNQRTLLDLLDAENEYFSAASDYITAQYTEMYAKYRLLNSMGKLMAYVGVARPVEANINMPHTGVNRNY